MEKRTNRRGLFSPAKRKNNTQQIQHCPRTPHNNFKTITMEEDAQKPGFFETMGQRWQYLMDKLSPQVLLRWFIFCFLFALYVLRVYLVNGWYIVTYGLGIYILNQLIGFLTPQVISSDEARFFQYFHSISPAPFLNKFCSFRNRKQFVIFQIHQNWCSLTLMKGVMASTRAYQPGKRKNSGDRPFIIFP